MIIAVFGDIDVGKSSLLARILINTNKINDKDIKKEINLSKNWLPNLIDTDINEKERGMTISSTKETFNINDTKYTIINNPGHPQLLFEILSNSSKADVALILISAKINETDKNIKNGFKYFLLSHVNSIKKFIFCITKCEFINSDNTYDNIVNKIKNNFKKLNHDNINFIPISAIDNINISINNTSIVNYCLFDLFKTLKNNIKEYKTIKTINNLLNTKLYFYDIPNILTIGFQCILFSLNKSYNVIFIDIKNDDKNFITKQNSKNKLISCILKINTNENLNNNIILISNSNIIAYGILN